MNYILKNEFLTVTISDIGGETLSILDKGGKEYMWRADPEIWKDRAPLLFPICGQIKDETYTYGGKSYHLKGHGFLPKLPLTATEHTDTRLVLSAKESAFTLEKYPFAFDITIVYSLIGKKLLMEATVKNTDEKVLPFMFGGHPGLSLAVSE